MTCYKGIKMHEKLAKLGKPSHNMCSVINYSYLAKIHIKTHNNLEILYHLLALKMIFKN